MKGFYKIKCTVVIVLLMGHYGCGVRKFQQLKKPEDIATYQLQPFEPNGALELYAIDSQSIKAILQNPHEELLIVFFTS